MDNTNPVDLLFGGMEKLGPGSNADTLHVLSLLPRQQFHVVVDSGCGTGRQTLALARKLGTRVHAVDSYEPFLGNLAQRAKEQHIEQLVQNHCMDMKDIRQAFQDIDLLWCEGAAYNIGFANALATWLPALAVGGLAVVSELVWLKEHAPDAVAEPGTSPGVWRGGRPGGVGGLPASWRAPSLAVSTRPGSRRPT